MKIHLVKKGETLFHIAKKYGIELQKLISFNSQLANPDKIDVGMKIKIPSAAVSVPAPSGAIVHKHVVVQGDSLWKLAKAWNVPLKAVIDANPHLKNPNVLMTGDIVYIPNLAEETPTDTGHLATEPAVGGAEHTDWHANNLVNPQLHEPMNEHLNEHMNEHLNEHMHEHVNEHMNEHVNEHMNEHVNEQLAAEKHMPETVNVHVEAIVEAKPELPVWPGKKEHAESTKPKMADHEAEFPFLQYSMPAMEAFQPYNLQPAQVAPVDHGKSKGKGKGKAEPYAMMPELSQSHPVSPFGHMQQPMPMPMPMPMNMQPMMQPMNQMPQMMPYFSNTPTAQPFHPFAQSPEQSFPSAFPWGYDNNSIMPEHHAPNEQVEAQQANVNAFSPFAMGPNAPQVSPVAHVPASKEKYPGIGGASASPFPIDGWHPSQAPANVSPFAQQQPFGIPSASGVPCLPCQQGYGYPAQGMFGMPYAMPAEAYPSSLSPHASLMQAEDCGCVGRDDRTGDIGLAPFEPADATRTDKAPPTKLTVSTKTRTKRKQKTATKSSKKQNQPWIRS
ncbi:LysM peptidoglycan-binding domain-containing protein [Paenibacillus hodogayensis]|uniref:LysM peptidoglycan-binding domain-containing protein n=1 Tax=Paenibacillus hodogayensis TaxID=279208 RepID=A0ABV5VVW8_9BACL